MIAEETDEHNVPNAVPHKRRTTEETRFPEDDITDRINPLKKAPRKAKIFTEENNPPKKDKPPRHAAVTAPKVAPALIPRSPGSARGFRKNIWKTAPLDASSAPDKSTRIERGKRKYFIKKTEGFSAPKIRLTKKARNRIKKRKKSLSLYSFFFIILLF